MATLTAIRHNPSIREFHARLIGAGKAKKVAIVACMRKLLTIVNAIMRDQRSWTMDASFTSPGAWLETQLLHRADVFELAAPAQSRCSCRTL